MLSYMLVRELRESWREVDETVEESLENLASLCGMRVCVTGQEPIYTIPKPRPELKRLFDLCEITPPTILPAGSTIVDPERKLPTRRKVK